MIEIEPTGPLPALYRFEEEEDLLISFLLCRASDTDTSRPLPSSTEVSTKMFFISSSVFGKASYNCRSKNRIPVFQGYKSESVHCFKRNAMKIYFLLWICFNVTFRKYPEKYCGAFPLPAGIVAWKMPQQAVGAFWKYLSTLFLRSTINFWPASVFYGIVPCVALFIVR